VLVTQELAPTPRFYTDVIGMAVSDRGAEEWGGLTIQAVFLHCNRRHHSIARGAGTPPVKRTAHFEMHVPDIDAVRFAWERACAAGWKSPTCPSATRTTCFRSTAPHRQASSGRSAPPATMLAPTGASGT